MKSCIWYLEIGLDSSPLALTGQPWVMTQDLQQLKLKGLDS